LLVSGKVGCWGRNLDHALGDETPGGYRMRVFAAPEALVEIRLGGSHGCGRAASGRVYCWGANRNGQLGDRRKIASIAAVPQITDAIGLELSGDRSCVQTRRKTFTCFGTGAECAPADIAHPPADERALGEAEQLSLGSCHYCTRRRGGAVDCWNTFANGPSGASSRLPLAPTRELASGGDHSCALLENGQIWCWGANGNGELGFSDGYGKSSQQPPGPVDFATGEIDQPPM
jgi:alpha-tubulin suppressor-like RCC1 family protein